GDRPRLLVAGEHQERGRAAVALRTHRVEAGLGMSQLRLAMRRHRAARVRVRVDQGSQAYRSLGHRVEVEPELAREAQVGPEAGRGDHLVDGQGPLVRSHHGQALAREVEALDGEAGYELDALPRHEV